MEKPFTVIVPFRNGHSIIAKLLQSIPEEIPVIVVDDVSEPAYDGPHSIRLDRRGYFSGAVNAGIKACNTDVLILNQDVWLEGDTWLAQLRGWQDAGYAIAGDGVMNHPAWLRGYVHGTAMFLSRAAIERVGLLNELDYPLWGATAEWQLRACRLGYKALPCIVGGLNHGRRGGVGSAIAQTLEDEPDKRSLFIRTPPAISVVMPCYNYGRYLRDALSSLLGGQSSLGNCPPQTFQSFEVVIVDDASTDDSWSIIQSVADEWKGIHVIRNEKNLGTAATLNVAIRAAHGKYITFLSADDMMEYIRLNKLYRVALANPHSFVYDNLTLFAHGKRFDEMPLLDYDFDKTLYKNGVHAGILYEKAAWYECRGYPEIMRDGREDWAFNIALGAKGYCGVHVKEPLYLYRREQQNRSIRNQDEREKFLGRLKELYPNLYRGEKPSMCCGKPKTKTTAASRVAGDRSPARSRAVTLGIGTEGTTLIEYIGVCGPRPFTAPATRHTYVFGGAHRHGYVDNRDLDYFIDCMEGRHHAFQRGQPIAPHLPEAEPIAEVAAPSPNIVTIDREDGISALEASNAAKVLEQRQEETKPKRKYTKKEKDV